MQQAVVLGIILLMIVLLLTQKATLGWIGLLIPCVLILTGISSPAEALQGLTSDSMFVFTGAFVLSEAFFQAGLSDLLGEWMQKKLRKIHHESLILLIICLISAGLSSHDVSDSCIRRKPESQQDKIHDGHRLCGNYWRNHDPDGYSSEYGGTRGL